MGLLRDPTRGRLEWLDPEYPAKVRRPRPVASRRCCGSTRVLVPNVILRPWVETRREQTTARSSHYCSTAALVKGEPVIRCDLI